jgi:hypothetical protein
MLSRLVTHPYCPDAGYDKQQRNHHPGQNIESICLPA